MSRPVHSNDGVTPTAAVVLGLLAFLCIALIGATGYMKLQLDRSQTTPPAVEMPLITDDTAAATAATPAPVTPQDAYRVWSMALTLTAWISLVVAALMVAVLYLTLRNRQAVPLKALAQSVENMSRGDMQTRIWGLERKDPIGNLARAIDLARYHFAQLPDLSLMSEQGAVRLKFEGETRSLFQAMMAKITGDYETARAEINGLTRTITTQQDLLTALSVRLNTAVNQLQHHGTYSQKALQNLTEDLTGSTRALLDVQEKAAAHVEKLVPFMQERAHNMAEVTHIAGTKVTQTLQNMLVTEQNLRGSMAQSQETITNLADSANAMNERLFAAVNLMQASGKALGETTEATQSRLNEAVETLARSETRLQQIAARSEERLSNAGEAEEMLVKVANKAEASVSRLETAIGTMNDRHDQLGEQVMLGAHRMDSIIASFDSAHKAMAEAMQTMRRDGGQLGGVLNDLRTNNDKLVESLGASSLSSHEAVQKLTERSHALMKQLEDHITQQITNTESRIAALASSSENLAQQAQTTTTSLAQSVAAIRQEQDKFMETRMRFGETIEHLGTQLEQQTAASFSKSEKAAEAGYGKLSAVAESIEAIAQRLTMLTQLTGTLGTVAGQLGQIVPNLSQVSGNNTEQQSMLQDVQTQWQKTMREVETMRGELTSLMLQQKEQLETGLAGLDKKLKNLPAGGIDPQQAAIMNEIIMALAKVNDHVLQLEEVVQDTGTRKA